MSKRVRLLLAQRIVRIKGEWQLWVYCCEWQLELTDRPGAHSESSPKAIKRALTALDGQALVSVSVSPRNGSSAFEFDLEAKLVTTKYDDMNSDGKPYENWFLFEPSTKVLIYYGDGTCSFRRSDKPPD